MVDYNYEAKNVLWDDGDMLDNLNCKSSYIEYISVEESFKAEVFEYVRLMKQEGFYTIVDMNKYLARNKLWNQFPTIRRKNTYSNGFTSIGVSRGAYSRIMNLYKTHDTIKSSLINQTKIDSIQIKRQNYIK